MKSEELKEELKIAKTKSNNLLYLNRLYTNFIYLDKFNNWDEVLKEKEKLKKIMINKNEPILPQKYLTQ